MKKIVALLCIVHFMCLFQGCNSSADYRSNNYTTSVLEYKKWSKDTENILQADFVYLLPDIKDVTQYGTQYYYKSSQAFLGDYNFVIYLEMQIDDAASYQRQWEKYASQLGSPIIADHTSYYLLQGSNNDILGFMDNEVYDGRFYNLEIISTNTSNNTIGFILAHVWDYYQDLVLQEFLQIYRGQGDGSVVSGDKGTVLLKTGDGSLS